jgi:hypothetical protein
MFAARLTTSLGGLLEDNFFRPEKRSPAGQQVNYHRQNA